MIVHFDIDSKSKWTKSTEKNLTPKCLTTCFFLHSLNYIHIFIFFLFCSTFLSLSFRGKLLVWKDMHTITYNHSLIHPSTHSLARSLTTHHCLNMVFAVVVVCFFHLPEKKKFIRNEHSQNSGENERTKERAKERRKKKSNCKCIRGFDMNWALTAIRTTKNDD